MALAERYDEIARCNRCGFCQAACPIFRSTAQEDGVARGRIALLRALVEKRVEWSSELKDPLFACLLCGACTAHCFPALPTASLLMDARAEYLQRVGRNHLHRLLFNQLLPYPKRLRLAARAAALGKKSGASHLAAALGLLRCFGRDCAKAENIVAQFPPRALREIVPPGELQGDGPALRIGYFVGCGVDLMQPEAGQATLRLLRTVGKTVTVLDNCCCGLPASTYGDQDAARKLAAKNLALLANAECDLIVTDCSSCASFLKKYPELFPAGDPQHAAAQMLSAKIRDFMQIAPAPAVPTEARPGRLIVTYHDPCHAVRGQNLAAEPRNILRALPDVEFRELPEAGWCCGGAGSYALSHYELSQQVLERKMDNLAKTGAQCLVTSCPACLVQLSYGVRQRKLPVRVCHLSELMTEKQKPV